MRRRGIVCFGQTIFGNRFADGPDDPVGFGGGLPRVGACGFSGRTFCTASCQDPQRSSRRSEGSSAPSAGSQAACRAELSHDG